MKTYLILNIKNFPEVLRGVTNASSDKGFQIYITSKVKNNMVSCVISAIKDGVIQGTGAFKAKLIMMEVDENGNERKVKEPSGWSRRISMPSYFEDAVLALGEQSATIFLSVYENEVIVSNDAAEVKVPITENFELSQGPKDLTVSKFSVDRKTLLTKVKRIMASSHAKAEDILCFRVSKEGIMEIISCCSYLIPKEKLPVTKIETEEKPFTEIDLCTLSLKKFMSLCNIEGERLEFTVYLDEKNFGKQVSINVDKSFTFLLNTKSHTNLGPSNVIAGFSYPDEAEKSYLYRYKINGKDLRRALSILTIGESGDLKDYIVCLKREVRGDKEFIIVSDEKKRHKAEIPCGEFEGIIPEDKSRILTNFGVIATQIAPFEEVVSVSHTGGMFYMTDGSLRSVSTFAKPKKVENTEEVDSTDDSEDDANAAD